MMNEYQIVEILSKTRKPRATIYLNGERVDGLYAQSVSAISELVKTGKLDARASASLATLFGGEVAAGREIAGNVSLTPLLKAILIEYQARQARQLLDLAVASPQPGSLLIYVGTGQIIDQDAAVTSADTNLPDAMAKLIQAERLRQENKLRKADDTVRTLVWLGLSGPRMLASVASSRWIDYNHMASYGSPPFGILGRYEREIGEVAFISPLWIWHEGW